MIFFDTVFATIPGLIRYQKSIIDSIIGGFLGIVVKSDILHKSPYIDSIEAFCFFDTVFATAAFFLMPGNNPVQYTLCKVRKGSRWFVEFAAYDTESGKLKKKRIFCPGRFTTTKQKTIWANDTKKEIDSLLINGYRFGTSAAPEAPEPEEAKTVACLVEKSLQHKKAVLKKKSFQTYSGILKEFLSWLGPGANGPIESLKQKHISNFQDSLLQKGLSTLTVNNKVNVVVTVFKHLEKRGHIEKKPVVFSRLPVTEEYRNRAFSKGHKARMELVLKENFPGLYLFTRLMYFQFLRPGDIIDLKIGSFDFDANTLSVSGASAKDRKISTLPLHPLLKPLLTEKSFLPGFFYLCGKNLLPGPARAGVNAATQAHAKALQLSGLETEGYTLYSWKHTGVIAAYSAGMDLIRLQHLLRHKSVTTTEIYLKSLRLMVEQMELKDW